MDEKAFKRLETAGAAAVFFIWLALSGLNYYESDRLLYVLFGSANNSVWEREKVLLLACVFWAVIELCRVKPSVKDFAAAKTAALYICGGAYAAVCPALELAGLEFGAVFRMLSAVIFAAAYHIISYFLLTRREEIGRYFVPALFLLLLFALVYVCFTIYPPKIALFYDFENNLYGIIPPNFDRGALCLDIMYGNR